MRWSAWWIAGAVCCALACTPRAVASPKDKERAPSKAAPIIAAVQPESAATPAQTAAPPAAIAAAPPASSEGSAIAARVDVLVSKALAEHRMPGCVVAVGHRQGLSFVRAYGLRSIVPAPESMTEDTIFDLASLSKAIATATAVHKLVEQGKLRLDERVARYLPELARPATREIRVRDLLLHAAGLPTEDSIRDYDRGPSAAIAALLAQNPVTPAGEFHYSDIGYLWLGELVRRVSGQPLDLFTHEQLFAPLGMRDTGFSPPASLLGRIAPTEVTDDRGAPHALIHGVVHDPRAYHLGGVAGNAGLFSSAADLARFARMLLGGGELEGTRVLDPASVEAMTRPVALGDSVRTLGWDMHSRYSRLRGTRLSERAFGHGGFTGVSLWLDPDRDLFVLLLSNRVHPDESGNVIGLAGDLADAAVEALDRPGGKAAEPEALPGIDALRLTGFAAVRGKRIGLLTHLAARSAEGETALDVLAAAPGVKLAALFSPEHGLEGKAEGAVPSGVLRDVPLYSLYGEQKRPTPAMLADLDLVVVDLVDVGTRFYTYMSSLHEMLRAAAPAHLPVLVLDRPNPIGGVAVEGPLLDPALHSFVNHFPLPIRHGMTAGELAQLINADERLGAALEVVEARNWCRDRLFEQTGLAWSAPSPNLRSPKSALLYPAVGLLEGTNLSVGRGTERPFFELGAPFIDSAKLLRELRRADLPGVRFRSASFTPKKPPYARERCHGVELELGDPYAFAPVRTGLALARSLRKLYPEQWEAEKLIDLLGDADSTKALLAGADESSIERGWQPQLKQFLARRKAFLRYPRCSAHN